MSTYTTNIVKDGKTFELLFGQDPVLNRLFMVIQEDEETGDELVYSNLDDEHLCANPSDYLNLDYFFNKAKELGFAFPQHLYDYLSTTECLERTPAQIQMFDKYIEFVEKYLKENPEKTIFCVPFHSIENITLIDKDFYSASISRQSEHNFGIPTETFALAIGEALSDAWIYEQMFDEKYEKLHGETATVESILKALKKLRDDGNKAFLLL